MPGIVSYSTKGLGAAGLNITDIKDIIGESFPNERTNISQCLNFGQVHSTARRFAEGGGTPSLNIHYIVP